MLPQLRYYLSILIALYLNPRFLVQILRQAGGQLWAVIAFGRPSYLLDVVAIHPPFGSGWRVVRGGHDKENSHSWWVINQRFAYDFVIFRDGRSCRGTGKSLHDYFAFGEPVLASGDGIVVEVRSDIADSKHAGSGWLHWFTADIRGNYVIIRHAASVYSLVAHLRQGSLRVNVGDAVRRGQIIGECGNSGFSTEPHIHFHVQNGRSFYTSLGSPIRFFASTVPETSRDDEPNQTIVAVSGDVIQPASAGSSHFAVVGRARGSMIQDFLVTLLFLFSNAVAAYLVVQTYWRVLSGLAMRV